jgi:site-specific DNA-methyltransferase (adenine-specific)
MATPREQLPLDSKGRHLVNVFEIDPTGRARTNPGDLSGLRDSIKRNGLIHAVILHPVPLPNGRYKLLVGGRRHMAHVQEQILQIPVLFWDELDQMHQLEIELEENFRTRKDFELLEQCALTARIDELKRKIHGSAGRGTEGWTLAKTAEATGQDVTTTSQQIKLHHDLEARPLLKAMVQEKKIPQNAAIKLVEQFKEMEKTQRLVSTGQLILTNDFRQGDCRELIKQVPNDSVGCLITDPPFGNETIAAGADLSRGATQSYTVTMQNTDNLSLQEVCELFRTLSGDIARVLKPGAYFYIFHAEDARPTLVHYLEYYGLVVVRPVLIWKKNRNTNAANGYNYMSYYEPIIFGYKPPAEARRRLTNSMPNVLEYAAVGGDRIHPFEKPQDLLCDLIKNSTAQGDLVLDPFGGSGATVLAAKSCGRSGLGFEINEKNFTLAQKRLLEQVPTTV